MWLATNRGFVPERTISTHTTLDWKNLTPTPPRAASSSSSSHEPPSSQQPHPNIPTATRADGLEYLRIEDIRHRLRRRPSPFTKDNNAGGGFVGDTDLLQIDIVRYETEESSGAQCQGLLDPANDMCVILPQFAVRSGPREHIYHDPQDVTAAIVTCGGLCPGLNDVVLNIVTTLADYGVPDDQILGIRYGLRGFLDRHAKPVKLSRREVDGIQLRGGTVLGTSRGNAKITEIVEVRCLSRPYFFSYPYFHATRSPGDITASASACGA